MTSRAPLRAAVAALAAATLATACTLERNPFADRETATESAAPLSEGAVSRELQRAITPTGLRAHLLELQRIAREHGGNRAVGTPGYDASARYVYEQLEAAGYDVRFDSFPVTGYMVRVEELRELRPRGRGFDAEAIEHSPSTRRGGMTGELAAAPVDADRSHGCERTDFADGFGGRIALVKRGRCVFAAKAKNAAAAGATALIVYNDEPGRLDAAFASFDRVPIPAVAVTEAAGETLARDAARGSTVVSLEVQASEGRSASRSVIAELRRGGTRPFVMAGAHLDSVDDGPGLNDNASGSAVVLELALRLAELEPRANVRFAFWGAEEVGLVGSRHYAGGLTRSQAARIGVYLNFDMVGSPNAARFFYQGEGAAGSRARRVSAAVARLFRSYFAGRRLPAEPLPFRGASDHSSFDERGIATGGLFTGAAETKTRADARAYGGAAGKPYDPCYHEPCDTLRNVDVAVLHEMADAAAHAVATLAANPSLLRR